MLSLVGLAGIDNLGEVGVASLEDGLLLGEGLNNLRRDVQVVNDGLLGSQGKPLSNRDIGEVGSLQDLKEDEILSTSVLDVVSISLGDVTNITSSEIESVGRARGLVDSSTTSTLQEVVPLVGRRVPVKLSHSTRLNSDQSSRECGSNGESGGVQNLDGTSGGFECLLLRPVVCVAGGAGQDAVGASDVLLANVLRLRSSVEDVELVVGQVLEGIDRGAEVLGQDRARSSGKHLADEESSVLIKVTLVKDKQELGTVLESLDRVRNTGREEPNVTLAKVVSKGLRVVVDGRNTDASLQDQGPFAGSVPVKLAVSVRLKLHIDTSHGRSSREHGSVLLTGPTSPTRSTGAVVRETQRPDGIGNSTRVRSGSRKQIGVQLLILKGTGAGVTATELTANGLGLFDTLEIEIDAEAGICILSGHFFDVLDHGTSVASVRNWSNTPLKSGATVQTARGSSNSRDWRSDARNRPAVLKRSNGLDPISWFVSFETLCDQRNFRKEYFHTGELERLPPASQAEGRQWQMKAWAAF